MIVELIVGVVLLGGGFLAGILVGRKNPKTVNAAVGAVTSAATVAETAAKKL
jgi:hypothetical protein